MSTISAGTTSTTTLVHSGDTTGSLVFKTNDTGSGGTTAVTIDTSQNVGIGTSLPTDNGGYGKIVDIYSSTGGAVYLHTSTATNYAFLGKYNSSTQLADSGSAGLTFATASGSTPVERMRIDSSGNVGIGTTSPGTNLQINSATGGAIRLQYIGNSGYGQVETNSNNELVFKTGGANERMRIDSSGNLLVGTTSVSSGKLNVVYTGTYGVYVGGASGASTQMIFFSGATNTGSISSNGSNTAFNTSSDYRLKENIAPMTGCLSKVQALKPVTYRWKESGLESQGFIAHELAEVCPEAVTGAKDAVDANGNPIYQGIDTSFLVATLTAALQETKALIDQQAKTINALTARVVALESK